MEFLSPVIKNIIDRIFHHVRYNIYMVAQLVECKDSRFKGCCQLQAKVCARITG